MGTTPKADSPSSSTLAAAGAQPALEPERQHFRALQLANPNYFGNLQGSGFAAVKVLKHVKDFEDLACVGLAPGFDRLEAVIRIKRDLGYGGDLCKAGSREYVRFFVDLHDDGVWHDVGLASVEVHDIPGDKPLSYAVYLDFEPIRQLCNTENLVKVRALLSWNVPPLANAPDFVPVYGDFLDVQVQIRPFFFQTFGILVDHLLLAGLTLPEPLAPVIAQIDPDLKLKALAPPVLSLAAKKKLYAARKVSASRFAFPEAQKLLAGPGFVSGITPKDFQNPLLELGFEPGELENLFLQVPALHDPKAFEELRCAALRPEQDLLEAVLTVKKSSGYSGGLCTAGSTEYVAFWMDFGDGAGFTYIGTSTVAVYDLASIPKHGVQYSVFLKTDLGGRIAPCTAGPRVVRLRAILSWEVPPPPANPDFVPVWGNREDCLVQLRPGVAAGHVPVIETVGNMGVDDIDAGTGLATGHGVGAAFTANQSPFGGVIHITGRIGDPPDAFNGADAKFKYRVEVSRAGVDDWHALTNTIAVKVSEFLHGVPQDCAPGGSFNLLCNTELTPTDDGDGLGDGWYDYLADYKGPWTRNLVQDQLASWSTDATMEGLWKIRITAKDTGTSPPTVYAGLAEVRVRIDNTAPTAALAITGATLSGVPIPAVDCGKFPVGAILTGTYEVRDRGTSSPNPHFGSLGFEVSPADAVMGAAVDPSGRSFPAVPTTGEAGTWTLDTEGMLPCGFVIRLTASDRTIWNSGAVGLSDFDDVGFCLEEKA